MKRKIYRNCVFLLITSIVVISCNGQKTFGTDFLQLEKSISMPEVKGRIDHIDVDIKDKFAYVAALGNNSLEIIDLQNGTIHSIAGLDEPQGVAYIPQQHEIFIANGGNGECYFYDAGNFQKKATIALGSDADDVRYDSASQKIYVGYGKGGIAVIDAITHQQKGNVRLPGHPESFQTDKKTNRIFVNVPDAGIIAVINVDKLQVTGKWRRSNPSANFPMALDSYHQRLFVGYRSPSRLEVINTENGETISMSEMVNDADDMYYDEVKGRIYISGGGGYINIFQQEDMNTYRQVANIPTRKGARTSFLISSLQILLVAARAEPGKDAELIMYKVNK